MSSGSGTAWLAANVPNEDSRKPWIETVADDLALATSFWR
jgi:hypothetical protein